MKKTVKSLLIVMIMTMVLATLTGCGDNDKKSDKDKKSSANTLVATKVFEDSTVGTYNETIEISFENDKAKEVNVTMDFEEEDDAESAEAMLKYVSQISEDISFERDGKTITAKMTMEAFIGLEDVEDEDLSRDAMKKDLEESGYTIKE